MEHWRALEMKKQQWRLKEMEEDVALGGSMELTQPKVREKTIASWKPRLSESCLAWARNGNFGLLTQCNRLHTAGNRLHRIKSIRYVHLTQCNRLHTAGNRLHTAGNRLHTAGNRLHSAGNRLHSAGNRLHSAGNRLHSAGNRLHSAGNQLHSAGNRLHISGNRLHRIKSIRFAHFSRCNRLHHVNRRMEYASSGALGALDVGFTICVNRRMEYASSGALGALDVGFTICVFVL
ncbi:hypothetical protein Lal_00031535 [Lupinus albus]|nr:hypothetical protein Lal_00031535 [Lupinus albus]